MLSIEVLRVENYFLCFLGGCLNEKMYFYLKLDGFFFCKMMIILNRMKLGLEFFGNWISLVDGNVFEWRI